MPLLLLFYPFAEIAVWWWFISTFSFFDSFLLCLTSAIVGIWVLKLQGGAAFAELQASAQNASLPSSRVVHRILMSFGALFLIVPGLIAKVIGFFLIMPGARHFTVWFLLWTFGRKLTKGFASFGKMGSLGGFVFTQGMARGFPQGPRTERTRNLPTKMSWT